MSFAIGSLVKARGREWVVLPESSDELLMLRPLGGTDDEVAGVYVPLERVEPARFDPPDPSQIGDYRSCRLLRDAIRLGFRSSAGPFRSFARLAVEPRPYQLVPLLMALRLDPVRLLIADDVGIGKTVEACLIARELMDRGEAHRLAILCPPHLAEQWQAELAAKFHSEAALVLPSTATRLERNCAVGQSLFDVYPHVVVSMDFIKTDRRRDEFLRTCPDLVIVDEAHTCATGEDGRGGRHQRYQLVRGLAAKPERHLVLVTATPHSGKEDAFRSLLALLDPSFAELPADLTGKENEHHRRRLAALFVQRRRGDIRHYLEADTPFPERETSEASYKLSPEYKKLFDRVLDYARETVSVPEERRHRQRVRWWAALALLRSLASSPAAAAATLRTRANTLDTETPEEADEIGRRTVLDLEGEEGAETADVTPGSDVEAAAAAPGAETRERRRLLDMAREAEALEGKKDEKLKKAVAMVKALLKDGFRPLLFCRFIATAEYVARHFREELPKGTEVIAVTGLLPPSEREVRVEQLAKAPARVLVSTDCLSEGVNLQEHFDAVVHYDLSWNPTRHEQREGRVDRYGQPKPKVRVVTYYGVDNQIDGIVLEVLLKKHQTIRSSLGISVPVPVDTNQVIEAVFEGLLLREKSGSSTGQQQLLFEDLLRPQREDLFKKWEAASEREKRSRTLFAQDAIKVDEVKRELVAVRSAIGSGVDVESFTRDALLAHKATVSSNGALRCDLREVPRALREVVGNRESFEARFELPVKEGVLYLNRTHPLIEGLAGFVTSTALDPLLGGVARRAGAIRTRGVQRRTTALLARFRFHLLTRSGEVERPLLAEACRLLAVAGSPENAEWLASAAAEALLRLEPEGNILPDQAREFVRKVVAGFPQLTPRLNEVAASFGEELLAAHRRVRQTSRVRGTSTRIEPVLPVDVLGVYVYLPLA